METRPEKAHLCHFNGKAGPSEGVPRPSLWPGIAQTAQPNWISAAKPSVALPDLGHRGSCAQTGWADEQKPRLCSQPSSHQHFQAALQEDRTDSCPG